MQLLVVAASLNEPLKGLLKTGDLEGFLNFDFVWRNVIREFVKLLIEKCRIQ